MKHLLNIIACVAFLFANSQNADSLFAKANTLYSASNYTEAIAVYKRILNTKQHSAELYYNLANAHYKLNNIAPSIYYYEKALLLQPNNTAIKTNLSFAQNMTVDAITTVPDVGFKRIVKQIINFTTTTNWAIAAIGGIFCFVVLFLIYQFSYRSNFKRIAFVTSILSFGLALLFLALAFQQNSLTAKHNPAILFAQDTTVKTEPKNASEELLRLHEGTKVNVLETFNGWYKVNLANNTQGWIPVENVKLIKQP